MKKVKINKSVSHKKH